MPPRSTVRTNIVIFTILGIVMALLIHFIVLSSVRYNWLDNIAPNGNLVPNGILYLRLLFG